MRSAKEHKPDRASWRKAGISLALALVCSALILGLPGCGTGSEENAGRSMSGEDTASTAADTVPMITAAQEAVPTDKEGRPIDTSRKGSRDNTPEVLVPTADGKVVLGNKSVTIDASNLSEGYLCIRYDGRASKVKIQITPPNENTYTYDVTTPGAFEFFPLSDGGGTYKVGIYSNVKDNMYATVYETSLDVELVNEYRPFLYPNQLVWFTKDTRAVRVAQEAAAPANDDLDTISLIYDYVIKHMTYDWNEASSVKSGYIPDVDAVLASGKGICFDYAALLSAMLRSQRIPTRMEIGYAGTAYHAWVSTYIREIGWVNGIIRFDGRDWELMDPTLATTESTKEYKDFISSGSNYRVIYLY